MSPAQTVVSMDIPRCGAILAAMDSVAFRKMHGLGNDFVVLDGRARALALSPAQIRAVADRRTGIGCDQLILIEPPVRVEADARMRIFNADGGEVGACGNATRCVARLLMDEAGRDRTVIETAAGLLGCSAAEGGLVRVDMGPVHRTWTSIPLAQPADTLHLPVAAGPLADGVAINVGNPHAVFFVDDAEAVPLTDCGPRVETDPLFPERTNVEAVQVLDTATLRLRVWERGVGITSACGTGACAAAAAAHLRGLAGRKVRVILDGGDLVIELQDDGHVLMTGPAALAFNGVIAPELLAGEAAAA
jgi:diaminopimelate epimerase